MQEIGIFEAIGRVILGMVILVGAFFVLNLVIYIGVMDSIAGKSIVAAYEDGYGEGYAQTHDSGYQASYGEAYDKGYEKGYEIGLEIKSGGEVATRVELHNPTYEELREFLTSDKTDANLYIKGVYMCANFAADVNNNAELQGIRAAYVIIHAREWSHAIVAFETVDRGLIFIEPILDKQVNVAVGESYWWVTGLVGSTRYDDTVVGLEFVW